MSRGISTALGNLTPIIRAVSLLSYRAECTDESVRRSLPPRISVHPSDVD